VDFETNDPRTPTVRVEISGRTEPADASGAWAPTEINFGFVPVTAGIARTRNALFLSLGQTPLLIRSLALRDEGVGFSWTILEIDPGRNEAVGAGARYQLDAGGSLTVQLSFAPNRIGAVQTVLVADTNSGTLELRLLAEGVDQ
jgi:hypothetical protein